MSKKQDRLLKDYKNAVHGVIFTQVSVGEHSHGRVHSEHRFIDGVRLVHSRDSTGKLKKFAENWREFGKQVEGKTVEAIEVDECLNRWVIGQAIVGKVMLEIKYKVSAAIPVVVCKERDTSLEQACTRLGVAVWTPRHRFLVRVDSSSKGTESS
jgi:hypothetical protein